MEIRTSHSHAHQSAPQVAQELPFEFTAENKPFWLFEIRNVLLTIVTFGIYSTWATVKRRNYFAQHTFLEGANFEYTADPMVIFRSRVVFFLIYAIWSVIPFVNFLLPLALMVVMPWAIACSISFHAKNTMYRGARFSFVAEKKETYVWAFKTGLVHCLSLGLGLPLVMRMVTGFIVENLSLGGKAFSMEKDLQPFIKLSMGFALRFGACCAGFCVLSYLSASGKASGDPSVIMGALYGLGFFGVIVAGLWALHNTLATTTNLIFGQIRFGGHRLESNEEGADLFWLTISNILLAVCTLGLAAPIVALRTRRYLYDRLKVQANGPLLQGVSLDPDGNSRGGSDAAGIAVMDFFGGIEIGL